MIATSTKVDLAGVKVDEKYNDAYFKRAVEKKKKTEDQFFAQETAAVSVCFQCVRCLPRACCIAVCCWLEFVLITCSLLFSLFLLSLLLLFLFLQTTQVDAQKVADQKAFDKPLLDTIKKTPLLAKYLSTRFSLTDSDAPHALKF